MPPNVCTGHASLKKFFVPNIKPIGILTGLHKPLHVCVRIFVGEFDVSGCGSNYF